MAKTPPVQGWRSWVLECGSHWRGYLHPSQPSPAAPSSPSRLGAALLSPRPAAGRRTLLCYVHLSAPMSALRSGVAGRELPPVEMPASLSWNAGGEGRSGVMGHPVGCWESLTRVSSRSLLSRNSFRSFSTFSSLLRSCWISS